MIEFLNAHWPEIVAGFTAALALGTSFINLRKAGQLKKALQAANERGTQVLCPHCKKKSPLHEVKFILPSGDVDNNLNGVPDSQE